MRQPGRNDPCPCGSARKAKRCCLAADGWYKRPASPSPPTPATGTALPACYAAPLNDCSTKVSGEHAVSKSILRNFPKIVVSGFPWQKPGEEKTVGLNSLVANVLCQRHNEALSPLDKQAGRLFKTFRAFDLGLRNAERAPEDGFVLFSGEDLERWLLKVLFGLLAAGNVSLNGERVQVPHVPESWLQVLYGGAPWPAETGLYVVYPQDRQFWAQSSIGCSALVELTGGGIMGMMVDVAGFSFALSMRKPNLDASPSFAGGIYRPGSLVFRRDGIRKTAKFSWADPRFNQPMVLTRVGQYDGPPPR